eukprot:TRINITY_DN97307_c0_g1_i1.p1 TRINITY_DN97307_c0_g1~~TRINITY_DN97307_c0_g1_i1.p1  ORF type:complete len:502 (+),score=94.68 TRINITY_DN97307_c0_g1_i1:33-1538(+)
MWILCIICAAFGGGFAEAYAVEAQLLWPPSVSDASRQGISDRRVTVRDLATQEPSLSHAAELAEQGFTVFRPGLQADDELGREELRRDLARGDSGAAITRLLDAKAALFSRLGFAWARCGEPRERRSGPLGLVPGEDRLLSFVPLPPPLGLPAMAMRGLTSFLRRMPTAGRLLKVSMAVRVAVQPLALQQANEDNSSRHRQRQRWWWHSEIGAGDAIVVDELLCRHSPMVLPGEDALQRARKAAQQLRAALTGDGSRGSPRRAAKVCGGIDAEVLDPAPYPIIGGRYTVDTKPSALVRRLESVESDVIGELRPGGVVTVLAKGLESPGRAQVYTEHALQMKGYISDGSAGGLDSSTSPHGGVTGWVSSAAYNGTRLLHPVSVPPVGQVPTQALAKLQDDFASTLRGICEWVNVTVGAAAAAPATDGSAWHVEHVRTRHVRTLEKNLLESEQLSVEAQCLAFEAPEPRQAVAAGITAVTILTGSCVLAAMRVASTSSPRFDM